jgi:hypothetical protein
MIPMKRPAMAFKEGFLNSPLAFRQKCLNGSSASTGKWATKMNSTQLGKKLW